MNKEPDNIRMLIRPLKPATASKAPRYEARHFASSDFVVVGRIMSDCLCDRNSSVEIP
jgi:hypothetical protein